MKNLFIALMAFALTLGVACKKNEDAGLSSSSVQKKEVVKLDLKDKTTALVNPGDAGGGGGDTGGGANSYPHNTGACTCGHYASCYPEYYCTAEYDGQGMGRLVWHKTAYGQTTFPQGCSFPGNEPRD